ncbi:hypothetical protein CDAR_517741 [Caerostris darwini]|uniref:Uncharacterized protein n=1 Tax=Caerostris darwini TaxID=1538125 RepID=A0AAV4SCS7_9ARAC|nr:hypothetical protein CDAR_517741 [Caerostris darwini]
MQGTRKLAGQVSPVLMIGGGKPANTITVLEEEQRYCAGKREHLGKPACNLSEQSIFPKSSWLVAHHLQVVAKPSQNGISIHDKQSGRHLVCEEEKEMTAHTYVALGLNFHRISITCSFHQNKGISIYEKAVQLSTVAYLRPRNGKLPMSSLLCLSSPQPAGDPGTADHQKREFYSYARDS